MKTIKRNVRVYLDGKTSNVTIRVRWFNNRNEINISLGNKWDLGKWDLGRQRPKLNTSCYGISYKEMCDKIDARIKSIESVFSEFEMEGNIPNKQKIKEALAERNGRENKNDICLDSLFEDFLSTMSTDHNWRSNSHKKYLTLWKKIHDVCPEVFKTETGFTKASLVKLKNWYFENNYSNSTTIRHFKSIKAILRFFKANGVEIDDSVVNFKANIPDIKRDVICLNYNELMEFYAFKCEQKELEETKDMWCFMAFTSLRFSDMQNLKWSNINNNCIEFITQKTLDKLSIPLMKEAIEILDKYKTEDSSGYVFPRIYNAVFNSNIKEAAKKAELNRCVTRSRISGTTAETPQFRLPDIISAHAARRTFTSISISNGIPVPVVMKFTGHKDYDSMRPYISISTETQKEELKKFNKDMPKNKENNPEDFYNRFVLSSLYRGYVGHAE